MRSVHSVVSFPNALHEIIFPLPLAVSVGLDELFEFVGKFNSFPLIHRAVALSLVVDFVAVELDDQVASRSRSMLVDLGVREDRLDH